MCFYGWVYHGQKNPTQNEKVEHLINRNHEPEEIFDRLLLCPLDMFTPPDHEHPFVEEKVGCENHRKKGNGIRDRKNKEHRNENECVHRAVSQKCDIEKPVQHASLVFVHCLKLSLYQPVSNEMCNRETKKKRKRNKRVHLPSPLDHERLGNERPSSMLIVTSPENLTRCCVFVFDNTDFMTLLCVSTTLAVCSKVCFCYDESVEPDLKTCHDSPLNRV